MTATTSLFTIVPERSILVLGATGALGGHLLSHLVNRGVPRSSVTAGGRNIGRLAELAAEGFRTEVVDFNDAPRIRELSNQHEEIVLISGGDHDRQIQHKRVIDVAREAGTKRIYYTSGVRADDNRFAINADHRATEQSLSASGLKYTILRNTWYIENYLQALEGPRYTGVLAAAVGDAVVAAATRADLAEALAVVITTDGHDGATYSLSGDVEFSYNDIAAAMSVVLGRRVDYRPVDSPTLLGLLQDAGLAAEARGFLVGLDETIAAGAFARTGDDLRRLLGRPTTGLIEGMRAK